jgi:hypothetical protein
LLINFSYISSMCYVPWLFSFEVVALFRKYRTPDWKIYLMFSYGIWHKQFYLSQFSFSYLLQRISALKTLVIILWLYVVGEGAVRRVGLHTVVLELDSRFVFSPLF